MIQIGYTELWIFLAILVAGFAFFGWIIASLAYHSGRIDGHRVGFAAARRANIERFTQKKGS